jgi:hypothetical protein
MRSHDVAEVVAGWIADRSLSRRKKAFLEMVYSQYWEAGAGCAPDTAGHYYASELDLPPGSFSIQVVAALLDLVEPQPAPSRLVQVTEDLVEDGQISREAAEDLYAHAL